MLDRETLSNLSQFQSAERPVLSLYLHVDSNVPEDKHLIHLKNLVAEVEDQRDGLASDVWQSVQRDLNRMRTWVKESAPADTQGLALFACGDKLWETFALPYPLESDITLADRPRLRPLFRLLQRFEQYLVILSDARDARVFMISPDDTQAVGQVEDDTPNRHDQGGWSQSRLQRHQDKMVEEHLEHAADLAFRLFQRHGFDGIVLMGTDERTALLEEQLHPYLLQRVLARVPMDMEAPARMIGETALSIARDRRRERQSEVLDRWEDNLGQGGQAVGGLEDTLLAAQQGQLMALLMSEELEIEGGRCERCGALTAQADGECNYCGGAIHHYDDLTEALTAAALEQGAELHVLARDGAAASRLNEHGGIGAMLRFAVA